MSVPSSVLRSPPHVLSSSSSAAIRAALPYFASTSPVTIPRASATTKYISKPLGTLPVVPAHPPQGLAPTWSSSTRPLFNAPAGIEPPKGPENERKVKLGKTLRILQKRLPTLLQSPLPQEILAPNISLHLFPSTYPYLPTVSGRVAYTAALWTSPIAWNRVPIIGNLKLEILSERMTTYPLHFTPQSTDAYPEQLLVKWRTAGKSKNEASASLTEQGEQKLDDVLRGTQSPGSKKEFTGLFIFEFDRDGKVVSHTIEHVDQGGEWEKGVGAKMVHLTDWLLGGMKGREPQGACPMFQAMDESTKRHR